MISLGKDGRGAVIVCEIGLNHLGDPAIAEHYVDTLCDSDVDAVTFQIREAEFYQDEKYRELVLPPSSYVDAKTRLQQAGKEFGFAIGSIDEVDFTLEFESDFMKILSWGLKDPNLIRYLLSRTSLPLYFSTGMSEFLEIDRFVELISGAKDQVRLIHTQLSDDINDVNLRAISAMKNRYDIPIAYGHHCEQLEALYLSLAFAPSDIFIYVKGSPERHYPDDSFAVPIDKIGRMISNLKSLPLALGEEKKIEMENKIEIMRDDVGFG